MQNQTIKGYELHERIGAGGFGEVYRAFQSTIGREVAIKIILPKYANHPDFIRRFESEAQIIARLAHPFIVPLHDAWRDPDGAYLVMRWLRGGSLHDSIKDGPLELPTLCQVMEHITAALSWAHRQGVVHRDLKPSNILLDEDGNAYLGDFGIAKDFLGIDHHTRSGELIGSPGYAAPEQARSDPVSPRTDIYSLGVMLYELLTGEHPFPNLAPVELFYKHLNEPIPVAKNLSPDIEDAINEVIQKATAKNPTHRYADIEAMIADFRQATRQDQPPSDSNVVEMLTQREQDILKLLIEGKSNKEIAAELFIVPGTVKWYNNQIFKKLNVMNRVQAIVRARELDLISTPSQPFEVSADLTYIPTGEFYPDNPYKGLKAFQAADNRDFFGREKITAKLIDRLRENDHFKRFLAVIGPSGSGKSSLVKAGLIPAIWRGDLKGSDQWYSIDMRPTAFPFDELEVSLTKVAANLSDNLHEQLTRDQRGLVRVAQLILPNDDTELLIIIDQFEEVFTLVEDEAMRTQFLDLLTTAVTDASSRVRIVVTLRADFYDRPLQYPKFAEMIRSRMETVLPLSAEELERAILKPAERVGMTFEDGLVATISEEVAYQPGALPLLQYALTELFEQRDGRLLTHEAYVQIGGAGGALAKRADDLYLELNETGREAIRQLFLRLVTLGEGTEDTRRRAARSELLAITDAVDLMDDIIDMYAEYRLLSLDHDPATRTPTVEVAHEAILREWERLRGWLNESRDDIKIQQQLATLAGEWEAHQHDESFLVRGTRLEQFQIWSLSTQLSMTPTEMDFLSASVEAQERREAEKQAQIERESRLEYRARKVLQGLVAVFLVASVVAIGLAVFAFGERATAQRERDRADKQAAIAAAESDNTRANFALSESQRLAAEANLLLVTDSSTELAALLGIQGLRTAYSPQADMLVQRTALYSFGERIFFTHTDIGAIAFTSDGNSIVIALYDGSIERRDFSSGDLQWQASGYSGPPSIAISPDNRLVLVSDAIVVQLHDIETGEVVRRFDDLSLAVAFSPDGRSILVFSDSAIQLIDIESGEIVHQFLGPADFATISLDGRYVATANRDDIVRVWDVETEQEIHQLVDHESADSILGISPDSRYLVIIGGKISVWNIQTGELLSQFAGHAERITDIAFSPDSRYLATSSLDSSARVWTLETGLEVHRFSAHRRSSFALDFSPDGRYLVTTSRDASARYWDLQSSTRSQVLTGTPGFSYGIVYSPDLRYLATAFAGDISLWDAATHQLVRTLNVPGVIAVDGIDFSPDGRYLVAADISQQRVHMFNVETGLAIHEWDGSPYNGTAIFTPDGREVLVSTPNGMFFYDTETGERTRQFTAEAGNSYLIYSPDSRYILTAGPPFRGKDAYLWDAQTGQKLRTFTGHTRDINSLAFTPDGRYVVTGSDDATANIWNLETGEIIQTLTSHTLRIYALDLTADGRFLLTGSLDGTARLWNLETGQEIRRFVAGGTIGSAIFSPDEQFVLIGSSDGRAYITPTRIEDLIASVCQSVLLDLTPAERGVYSIKSTAPTCP